MSEKSPLTGRHGDTETQVDENQIGTIVVELKLGYLLNFGEALMKDGITRIINGQL